MFDTLRKILAGHEAVKLYLAFLKLNNKTDLLILKHTKVFALLTRSCRFQLTVHSISGLA